MNKMADVFDAEEQPPSYKERLSRASTLKAMTPTEKLMLTVIGLGLTTAGAAAAKPYITEDPRLVAGKMKMWGDDVEHKELKRVKEDDDRELSESDRLLSDMIPDSVLMEYVQDADQDSGPSMPDMD